MAKGGEANRGGRNINVENDSDDEAADARVQDAFNRKQQVHAGRTGGGSQY